MTAQPHDWPLPTARDLGPRDWFRVLRRGLPMAVLVFGGLLVSLLIRAVEAPIHGARRPWTPGLTVAVCRGALRLLGLGVVVRGTVMDTPGAVVANHATWLDIFVLNANKRIYFVAKSEVAGWPGIGWLARATGTVFIRRDPREARTQIDTFRDRTRIGHRLLFFPEGTSTDGQQVLPFRPTLFAAFLDPELKPGLSIQPVTVAYRPPPGGDPRLYGWWGDMDFTPHLLGVLALRRQGRVIVTYHPPVRVADHEDRKRLAADLHRTIAGTLAENLREPLEG